MNIANGTGAAVRADLNNALSAIATNNSGGSAPSTTFASQFFANTSVGIMQLRNTSNNGYVNLFSLAGGIHVDAVSVFNNDIVFTGATVNIIFDRSANSFNFADNAKAQFGASADLAIFHDTNNSFIIESGTGGLFILSSEFTVANPALSKSMIKAFENSKVELYFDTSKKFETASTGIIVTGNVDIPDDSKFAAGNNGDLQLSHSSTFNNSLIKNDTGDLFFRSGTAFHFQNKLGNKNLATFSENSHVDLFFDGNLRLRTTTGGVDVVGTVNETSDIALKSNIQPLTNTLEKLQQITGYKYNLLNSISPSMGVIAQDVEKVFPELVHGSEGKKTLQYSGLIGVLVEAVKDLSTKVAALEAD